MRGLGTISNALAIVIGGVLGILFKRFLKERYQDTIIKATGFSVVFLGAAGTLSKILTVRPDGTLSTGGSMVMILSLALGALLGELMDLDAQFERSSWRPPWARAACFHLFRWQCCKVP